MGDIIKPKLLFLYPNQFGYHTDSHKYCEHLRESFDLTYFCFDQGFERIDLTGINIIYMPFNIGKIKRLVHFYRHIINYTREAEPDIIFTVQFKFCFLIGVFTNARLKILDYRTGDLSLNPIKRRIKNGWLWFDSLFFTNISAISEGCRDMLYLNKRKTFILPLGGDILSNKPHSYKRLELLYVGSFNLRNIYQTVEGIAMFLKENKEYRSLVRYTIIGFGYKKDEELIKNTIKVNGLIEVVKFIGRVRYTDLPSYFDSCNIGVSYVPITPGYEYQPVTKTFEYANSGLFTIATNTFENRKVITPLNGVLCSDTSEGFAEALEQVFRIKDRISEEEIRDSLKGYQWGNIVQNTLKPYLFRLLEENA